MKIYNNNFVQVQSQENLPNTTVNINLYRRLNYIFTLTFKLKNDSSKFMVLGGKGWRSGESARLLAPTNMARVQILASTPSVGCVCCWLRLLCSKRFFSRYSGFPSPQKPVFPNSNSTRNLVDEEPLCGCVISKSLFIYFLFKI